MLSIGTMVENGEIEKLVRVVLSYKRSIVLVTLLVLLFVGFTAFRLPFEYKAQTTIFPSVMLRGQEGRFQAGLLAGVSRQLGINFGGGAADQSILYESMLKSRMFLDRILLSEIETKDGDRLPYFEYLIREDLERERKLLRAYELFLVGKLRVFYQPETGMTTITVISFDPVIAAKVCNRIVEEFEVYTHELLAANSEDYAQFIDGRIDEVTRRLEASELELNEFMQKNRTIVGSPALSLQLTRLQREVFLQQQLFLSLKEQFELANIEARKDISIIAVLDEAVVPIAKFRPRRSVYLVFGLVFGGLLGMAQALVRHYRVVRVQRHPA